MKVLQQNKIICKLMPSREFPQFLSRRANYFPSIKMNVKIAFGGYYCNLY